jgi:hypothetical protein
MDEHPTLKLPSYPTYLPKSDRDPVGREPSLTTTGSSFTQKLKKHYAMTG